jgi:hypothetical protein
MHDGEYTKVNEEEALEAHMAEELEKAKRTLATRRPLTVIVKDPITGLRHAATSKAHAALLAAVDGETPEDFEDFWSYNIEGALGPHGSYTVDDQVYFDPEDDEELLDNQGLIDNKEQTNWEEVSNAYQHAANMLKP